MPLHLLLFAFLCPSVWGQPRVSAAPEVVAPAAGGQAGAAAMGASAAVLTAPSVVPSLTSPVSPTVVAGIRPSAAPSLAVAQAIPQAALPRAILAAPGAAPILPNSALAPGPLDLTSGPAGANEAENLAQASPGKPAGPASAGLKNQRPDLDGRRLFDGAGIGARNPSFEAVAAPLRSLWGGVSRLLSRPDEAPAFPPRPGQKVRVAGKSYELGRLMASGEGWSLHELGGFGRSEEAVLLFAPEAKEAFNAEKAALEALARTDIPHAKLKAAGDGALVLVRANLNGWDARAIFKQGPTRHQRSGLADLAARLVRGGMTADLSVENLIWEHWKGQWTLIKGAGYRMGSAWDAIGGLWALDGAVSDRAGFLAALRGRLGPESDSWGRLTGEAAAHPELRAGLDELARRDAARAPPEALRFGPGSRVAALDNSLLSGREAAKRLGYDPLSVKDRAAMHADDPGKLNTVVSELKPPGKPARVLKMADEHIVRAELFTRKAITAFFGRYFETPGALAVLRGYESYLVMEKAEGGASWSGPRLSREQRAALALLVHTFGLGDMNPGNVFYGPRVWLIDFEQALSRHGPVSNRIPDDGILAEMPWVNAADPPPMEDFLVAVRDWREYFMAPANQSAVEAMLKGSGYSPEATARALTTFRANAADLDWTIQADVDFADGQRRR